jgi:serine/threonine protein kinase/Tfp pilus assembly protein PilF
VDEARTVTGTAETACRLLERLWDAGQRPDVTQLLTEAGIVDAAEAARVLALDQWRRWHVGERVPAEEYMKRFPQVAACPEAALELIYGEMLVREELGERPTAEEYQARFPDRAEALRQQLLLHQDLDTEPAATHAPPGAGQRTLRIGRGEPAQPIPGLPAVPGYEILAVLGRGGMGVVYKALHLGLKRLVALKMILDQPGSRQADLGRFRIEAEAVARLQHPNIVQIYEVGEWSGDDLDLRLPFLALEFVDGGTLGQRLAAGPLEPRTAAELAEILARAMHAAHLRGIVHRDLKPANVLVSNGVASGEWSKSNTPPSTHHSALGTHQLKITDFGLAKLLDTECGQTRTGEVLGTPSYMAPEQAQGWVREVGPVTDVYALGAILYHALTGRPPFKGASVMETMLKVVQQEPTPPTQLQPKLPLDLETICLKCLKKDGGQRYGSALELAEDLRRFLQGEPIQARPVGAWERAAKWVRRRPALAGAVIASVLIVLGSISGFLIYLNVALDDARREWHNETQRAQRAERRSEAQDLVHRAEDAAHAQDWQGAALHAAQALRRIGDAEEGSDLRQRAAEVQGQAEQQLNDRDHLAQFKKYRSEALSRWGLLSGGALPADLEKTQEAARAALDKFQVDPEAGGALALSANYTAAEKTAIVSDCYELLLMLADAVAAPRPGFKAEMPLEQTRQAVRILQRAARLGLVTQAYHRRLVDYCKRLGDESGARRAADQAATVPPAGALDYFLSGQERYRSGQLEAARAEFGRALLAQPDHFWARYFHALCQLRLHKGDAAVADLTACLGQDRAFVWLYVLRALAHVEAGDFAAAMADFDSALARQPDEDARYGIHVNRASLRLRQGRPKDAIDDLNAAIALKPDHYQAYLNLAQVYRQQKDWDTAAKQLQQALEKAPQLATLYRTSAQLAMDRDDTAAALVDFRKAIQLETASAEARANDYVEIGRLLQRARKYDEALTEYDAALQERSDQQAALRGRGETLLELKRHKEAVQAFDRCLDVGPPSADVHRLRGIARTETHDYRGARDDYSWALLSEATAELYARRGKLNLVTDTFNLARQDFDQAINLGPANGEMYAGRGFAQVRLGLTKEALDDAREAVQFRPESPLLLYNVARIYSQALAQPDGPVKRRDAELRLDCQKEAFRLINRALDMLPTAQRPLFWKETIHPDKALDPLRRLSMEFIRLEKANR